MQLPKQRYPIIFLISLFIPFFVACAGNNEPEVATPTPTPELAVVVFATPEPTPTQAPPTPTKAATVGVVIKPAENSQASDTLSLSNRPADENPLTGLKIDDPALLQRRPLMVRIGNDPGARPQVALNEADIVYEEIVEWWITRFTAIYLSKDPETIAPIRSARLINLQLVPQYQGAFLNSGGSDPVRWELSQTDIVNLDEFFVPQPYFYRPNEGWQTRLAVDATAARDYLANEGLESNVKLRGFFFDDPLELEDLPKEQIGEAQEVIIPYPKLTSEAKWVYDDKSGRYLRFTADEPMMDFNGDQLSAANVIVYFAEHQDTDIVEDSNGATSIRIVANGKGTAWLFRDGKVLKGNWESNDRETPLFTFDDGQLMPLKPGNSWIEVVPLEYEIIVDGTAQAREVAPATTPETAGENNPPPTPSPTATPIGARPRATPTPSQ